MFPLLIKKYLIKSHSAEQTSQQACPFQKTGSIVFFNFNSNIQLYYWQ